MNRCTSCGKWPEEGDRMSVVPFTCRPCEASLFRARDTAMRKRGYDPVSIMLAQMMGLPVPPTVLELYGL